MARRIRKQVNELTSDDLDKSPCWEYADDEEGTRGQDECTVRPLADDLTEVEHAVLMQATFVFPNGRVRLGTVTCNAGEEISGYQPVLFLGNEQLYFYYGAMKPKANEIRRLSSKLKRICPNPFPIRYTSTFFSDEGKALVSGVLEGFYWRSDWRKGIIEVIK